MEQHPVPQHIAAYEFRLVGDMTIKQFGFLATGILVALAFYATPFPGYVKWPGIIFSGFSGFAFAFIPVQERPLSKWAVAFGKSIFSPTQYVWKKKAQEPEILKAAAARKATGIKPARAPDRQQLTEYLKTLPPQTKTAMEQREEGYLQQVSNLFQLTKVPAATAPAAQPPVRPPTFPLRGVPVFQPKPTPPLSPPLPPKKVSAEIVLPEKPGRPPQTAIQAKSGHDLPIPSPPTQPNILVGIVLDKNNKLVEGALLEIRNSKGIAVRALKTNKLGQFRIAFPLENDTYVIETEKEDHQFDTIKMEAKGKIIPPIEIKAK